VRWNVVLWNGKGTCSSEEWVDEMWYYGMVREHVVENGWNGMWYYGMVRKHVIKKNGWDGMWQRGMVRKCVVKKNG
jgi:hypothetical protein